MAAEAGCDVANSVTKKVTMLAVGTQDKSKLKGYEKNGNHRKAEALIEKGVDIQIFSESDFSELLESVPKYVFVLHSLTNPLTRICTPVEEQAKFDRSNGRLEIICRFTLWLSDASESQLTEITQLI